MEQVEKMAEGEKLPSAIIKTRKKKVTQKALVAKYFRP
jgi:hypothetical protein